MLGVENTHYHDDPTRAMSYVMTQDDSDLCLKMNAFWADFVATGDPNGANSTAVWPPFDGTGYPASRAVWLAASHVGPVADHKTDQCAFWCEIDAKRLVYQPWC